MCSIEIIVHDCGLSDKDLAGANEQIEADAAREAGRTRASGPLVALEAIRAIAASAVKELPPPPNKSETPFEGWDPVAMFRKKEPTPELRKQRPLFDGWDPMAAFRKR